MTGTVNINGINYQVSIPDLTPADVLPVFRTDTSIVKTDSILLHAAGAEQNSAKKVLLPHLISLISNAMAENVALTIEPYYDVNDVYQGMYWHYNGQWLRRTDTGDMIRVDDTAAEMALAAEQAIEAAIAAKEAATLASNTEARISQAEEARQQAAIPRVRQQILGTVGIDPNVFNIWSEGNDLAELTVTFNQGQPGLVNEYMMRIFVEHDNFVLTLPPGIIWPYDEPEMENGYVYDISVIGSLGVFASWQVGEE